MGAGDVVEAQLIGSGGGLANPVAEPCEAQSEEESFESEESSSSVDSSESEDAVDAGELEADVDELSDGELGRRLAARLLAPAESIATPSHPSQETPSTGSVANNAPSVAAKTLAASVAAKTLAAAFNGSKTNGTLVSASGARATSLATSGAGSATSSTVPAIAKQGSATSSTVPVRVPHAAQDARNYAERVELVDSESRCRVVCDDLLKHNSLAVDIEGVSLGRHGEICIVQAADRRRRVFLFDVTTLGKAAFTSGLKELLESEAVTKLFFDCRGDTDALFHLFGVTPRNVLDMQVLCHKAKAGGSLFLLGFAKAIGHVLPYAEEQIAKGIKAAGQSLFAPDRGGSFEVWKKRPLSPVLKRYCAQDVVHLFTMLSQWGSCLPLDTLRQVSEERMRKRIHSKVPETGPQLARKDFAFPAEKPATPRLVKVPAASNGAAASVAEAPPAKRIRTDA